MNLMVTISTNEPQSYNCDFSYLGTTQTDMLAFLFPDLLSSYYRISLPHKAMYLGMFVIKKYIKKYSCFSIFPQSYYSHTVDFFFPVSVKQSISSAIGCLSWHAPSLYLQTKNSCVSKWVHTRPCKEVSSGPQRNELVGSPDKWGSEHTHAMCICSGLGWPWNGW